VLFGRLGALSSTTTLECLDKKTGSSTCLERPESWKSSDVLDTLLLLAWLVGFELTPAVKIEVCPLCLGWLGNAVLPPTPFAAFMKGGSGCC